VASIIQRQPFPGDHRSEHREETKTLSKSDNLKAGYNRPETSPDSIDFEPRNVCD